MPEPRALVSIHDLMPGTVPAVQRTCEFLEARGVAPVTVLVVPGAGWDDDGIELLHRLQGRGYQLAGHGWTHRVERLRGLGARLHGAVISRNVAEHLGLDAGGIAALIERCHGWFAEQGLAPPQLYVPPAWAMGPIPRAGLRSLPFRYYETLAGVYDAREDRFERIPMVGFEADTLLRVLPIRLWNAFNDVAARLRGVLRVGIHPYDLDLRLAGDLSRRFAAPSPWRGYGAVTLR